MSKRLKVLAASLLGIGFLPGMPGTFASAVAAVAHVAVGGPSGPVAWLVLAAIVAAGMWAASDSERTFGSRDPRACVIDEAAGMHLALLAAGVAGWGWTAVAFVLFRLFDMAKPFPIRQIERLDGALGIMCDDLAAGVAAGLLTRLAVFVLVS